jgi:hypothetical protein
LLRALLELGDRLLATDTSTARKEGKTENPKSETVSTAKKERRDAPPVVGSTGVLVGVVGLDGRDELGELSLVLSLDVSEREDGGGLAANDGTETGLTLDDGVGDTHLLAESGEEDDELDGVDVVGDDDEVGLLVLDERDDVVETGLDEEGLLGLVELLAGGDVGGVGGEALLLLLLGLTLVLVGEAEELGSGVLVKDLSELGDRRGGLEALVEDDLLALETNVLGPLDEASKVGSGADGLACTMGRDGREQEEEVTKGGQYEPIPNCLGRDSKRGLVVFLVDLEAPGALATFLEGACRGGNESVTLRGREERRKRKRTCRHRERRRGCKEAGAVSLRFVPS